MEPGSRHHHFQTVGSFGLPLLLFGLLVGGGAIHLTAQEPRPADPEVPGVERGAYVSPWSGPPGTTVTVRGQSLPAVTPVHLALGGTRTGFEALSFVLTSRTGDLEEELEIPEWAQRDRAHRIIIFDAYFSPLATSALFHVTDADGHVVRVGQVLERREGCVEFLGDDEERYSLLGELENVAAGQQLEVEARLLMEESECGDGIPAEVVRFQRRGGQSGR